MFLKQLRFCQLELLLLAGSVYKQELAAILIVIGIFASSSVYGFCYVVFETVL